MLLKGYNSSSFRSRLSDTNLFRTLSGVHIVLYDFFFESWVQTKNTNKFVRHPVYPYQSACQCILFDFFRMKIYRVRSSHFFHNKRQKPNTLLPPPKKITFSLAAGSIAGISIKLLYSNINLTPGNFFSIHDSRNLVSCTWLWIWFFLYLYRFWELKIKI